MSLRFLIFLMHTNQNSIVIVYFSCKTLSVTFELLSFFNKVTHQSPFSFLSRIEPQKVLSGWYRPQLQNKFPGIPDSAIPQKFLKKKFRNFSLISKNSYEKDSSVGINMKLMVVVLASLNNLTFEINFRDRKIAGGQKQRRLF